MRGILQYRMTILRLISFFRVKCHRFPIIPPGPCSYETSVDLASDLHDRPFDLP